MWVGRAEHERLIDSNEGLINALLKERQLTTTANALYMAINEQHAKDEVSIDWLRHRVNALEKERVVLMRNLNPQFQFAAPEIEVASPRLDTSHLPDFDTIPSFEDAGDEEAARLGIVHDRDGILTYQK